MLLKSKLILLNTYKYNIYIYISHLVPLIFLYVKVVKASSSFANYEKTALKRLAS